jgi:hypothetical protein
MKTGSTLPCFGNTREKRKPETVRRNFYVNLWLIKNYFVLHVFIHDTTYIHAYRQEYMNLNSAA